LKNIIFEMMIKRITLSLFIAVLITGILVSCSALIPKLNPVTIIKKEATSNYKYVYIATTGNLTSGTSSIYGNNNSLVGVQTNKTVNPGDVISGILTKKGFIRVPKINSPNETMIVNYGESGRRETGLGGYTIEVTIQFISANNNQLICSCTAEGQGATEADDIRQAISRCLSGLL